ncbi:hypothetical protein ACFL2Z_05720, partial [Candidatus Eisenbacteria bacterium]
VVWTDYRNSNVGVYHMFYDGVTWSVDSLISMAAATAYSPSIAADGAGNVHAVWTDHRDGASEIYYRAYDGSGWGPSQRLTNDPSSSLYPSVAAGYAGSVHVVWQDIRDGAWEIYCKTHDGVAWSDDVRLTNSTSASTYTSIAVDAAGDVHVVWQDTRDGNDEIYYGRYHNAWGPNERLTVDPNVSEHPCIAIASDGRVHVVWNDDRDGNKEIYHKTFDGVLWSADTRLTYYSANSIKPSIAPDDSDGVHVVWLDSRDSHDDIYYKGFDGITWGPDESLTDVSVVTSPRNASISLDGQGNRNVVFQDRRDGNFEIYWKLFYAPELPDPEITSIVPAEGPAGEVTEITGLSGADFASPARVWLHKAGETDIAGFDVTVWSSQMITFHLELMGAAEGEWDVVLENPDGKQATLEGGFSVLASLWSDDVRLTNDPASSSIPEPNARCVAADDLGNLHVVWSDERDGNSEIYYKKHNGTAWGADERLTVDASYSHSPSLATYGSEIHVVWNDYRDGNWELYYKHHDGAAWGPDERLTTESYGSLYPSAAVNSTGALHVVWEDARGEQCYRIYHKVFDGMEWGPDELISERPVTHHTPAIAIDTSDNIHVVFYKERVQTDLGEVRYKMFDGLSWTAEIILTTGGNVGAPTIAPDSQGNVHVAWHEGPYFEYDVFYKRFNGSDWDATYQVSNAEQCAYFASAAADNDGNAYVVWSEILGGNRELYIRQFDGISWRPEMRLTDAPGVSVYPSTAVDEEGRLHVVWRDDRDGNQEIYYKLRDTLLYAGTDDYRPLPPPPALAFK